MLTELRALLVARAATASDRVDEVLPTNLPWLGADEAVRLFDPDPAGVGRVPARRAARAAGGVRTG